MTTTRIDNCPICKGSHLIHKLSYTDSISGKTFEILQCSDCGLHITQYAPILADMGAFYPDSDSECYKPAKTPERKWLHRLHEWWYKKQVKIVKEESQRMSGVLLEMGSEQGHFSQAMRGNGWIAHGVEYDATAREYGNKRFQQQVEDGSRLFDINPRSYNVVVAWDTLGKSFNINKTMEKLSQLIVSDGTLVIAFHSAVSDDAQYYGSNWSAWDAPRKRWHLTPQAFEKLIEPYNLVITNRSHSTYRSFITNVMSELSSQQKPNIWLSMWRALKRNSRTQDNYTYYIYTLKRK